MNPERVVFGIDKGPEDYGVFVEDSYDKISREKWIRKNCKKFATMTFRGLAFHIFSQSVRRTMKPPNAYEVIHEDHQYFTIDCDATYTKCEDVCADAKASSEAILGERLYAKLRGLHEVLWGSEALNCLDFENVGKLRANFIRRCIMKRTKTQLQELFTEPVAVEIDVLDSSTTKKLSLHIHTNLGIYQWHVEGSVLCSLLNIALTTELLRSVKSVNEMCECPGTICICGVPERWDVEKIFGLYEPCECKVHGALSTSITEDMIVLAMTWPWHVKTKSVKDLCQHGLADHAVYSRKRLFRLIGNSKIGKSNALKEVDKRTGDIRRLPDTAEDLLTLWEQKYRIKAAKRDTIIHFVDKDTFGCLYISPSAFHSIQSRPLPYGEIPLHPGSSMVYNGPLSLKVPHVNVLRELGIDVEGTALRQSAREAQWKEPPVVSRHVDRVQDEPKYEIMRSDVALYGDSFVPVMAGDVDPGAVLHCPKCDIRNGEPDGNPSMRALEDRGSLETSLYAFCCRTFFVIRHVVDYEGFKTSAFIIPENQQYITADDFIRDTHVLPEVRCGPFAQARAIGKRLLIAVNAPMGSGKTYAASSLVQRHFAEDGFLIVTYRRALARQLAERFNCECYLDLPGHKDINEKRLVICTNSMGRMHRGQNAVNYACVVFDEAAFIRKHFVQGTMVTRQQRKVAYDGCCRYARNAAVVIIMQHALSNKDVSFYQSMSGISSEDTRRIYKTRQALQDIYEITNDRKLWILTLQQRILANKFVFIPCSTVQDAEVLYILITGDKGLFRPQRFTAEAWKERVALLTSGRCEPRALLNCVEEFPLNYKLFSVAICTSTLETGVSLTHHYEHVFGTFRKLPIVHTTQAQLANRVRNAKEALLFVEPGKPFVYMTEAKRIARELSKDITDIEDSIFHDTVAEVMSEKADTFNFNDILWHEVENAKKLPDLDPDSQEAAEAEEIMTVYSNVVSSNRASVRSYQLSKQTQSGHEPENVHTQVAIDTIAVSQASRKLNKKCDMFGSNGRDLSLAFQRINTFDSKQKRSNTRSGAHHTFFKEAIVTSNAMRTFLFMAYTDYLVSLQQFDREQIREASIWAYLSDLACTTEPGIRALAMQLSSVTFTSRVISAAFGTFLPPSSTTSQGVLVNKCWDNIVQVIAGDGEYVRSCPQEQAWARFGRPRTAKIASTFKKADPAERALKLAAFIRKETPLQPISGRKRDRGNDARTLCIRRYCTNAIGLVVACMQPNALGLRSSFSTQCFMFFKEDVTKLQNCVSAFQEAQECVSVLRETGGYTAHHRELDYNSIQECGFFGACEALAERMNMAASILSRT